jgi:hypothetical protein
MRQSGAMLLRSLHNSPQLMRLAHAVWKNCHKNFAFGRNLPHHYGVTSGGNVICGVPVMIHAADYRAKAADCARRAEEAQDNYHRKNFRELATMWSEMADKAEGRVANVEGMPEREDDERRPADQKAIDDALATIKNADTN